MSSSQPDRPARHARTKPRPAPDAGVDPIDPRPAEAPSAPERPLIAGKEDKAPTAAPTGGTPREPDNLAGSLIPTPAPQATVQLNVRISPDVAELVDKAAKQGYSKRAIVEDALRRVWGR